MLGDILETITDLVDLADRNLAKLFTEPWPPNEPLNHHTHRVVYARRQTYYDSVQTTTSRAGYAMTTLKTRATPVPPSRKSWPSETRPPRKYPGGINKSDPKLRNPVAESQRRVQSRTNYIPATGITRPTSTPTVIENNRKGGRITHTLAKPVKIDPRRVRGLRLDEIRPDLAQCDVLVIAVAEMEICKEIFAGWRAQLNLADPRRNEKLELTIIATVKKLHIGASAALRTSHSLLRKYRILLSTIERSLNEISQTRTGGNVFSAEISSLASAISAHSRALSRYVKQMQERLRTLVKDIEKTKESADKRALKRKIWKWLSLAFKALSALLSAGGAIFALFHPIGLLESAAIAGASMLSGAAARLCDLVQDKYSETTFDEILAFLRDDIPESAKAAEIALTSFQACQRILQVELEVRKGKRSGWVSASEAQRARGQWAQAEQRLQTPLVRQSR